jgi:hypothetical protein
MARLRAIAHRLEVAAYWTDKGGAPAYARQLREDAEYLRKLDDAAKDDVNDLLRKIKTLPQRAS